MRTAKLGFLYIALFCLVAAVWIPEFMWQYLITAGVLLIAAAGIQGMTNDEGDSK